MDAGAKAEVDWLIELVGNLRNAKAELERVEYLHALRLRKFEAEVARCCPGLARECLARAEAEWQRTLSHMAVHGVATASAATSSRDAADAFEE